MSQPKHPGAFRLVYLVLIRPTKFVEISKAYEEEVNRLQKERDAEREDCRGCHS